MVWTVTDQCRISVIYCFLENQQHSHRIKHLVSKGIVTVKTCFPNYCPPYLIYKVVMTEACQTSQQLEKLVCIPLGLI